MSPAQALHGLCILKFLLSDAIQEFQLDARLTMSQFDQWKQAFSNAFRLLEKLLDHPCGEIAPFRPRIVGAIHRLCNVYLDVLSGNRVDTKTAGDVVFCLTSYVCFFSLSSNLSQHKTAPLKDRGGSFPHCDLFRTHLWGRHPCSSRRNCIPQKGGYRSTCRSQFMCG